MIGGGFLGLLTLLLVAAKLFGFAQYSWLVAFSPVLGGAALATLVFLTVFAIAVAKAAKRRKHVLILPLALLPLLGGCGYSSRDNELVGQVKKVVSATPIVCPDYSTVDLSLGVMRNGQGSMSKEDVWLRVMNAGDVPRLKALADRGAIVKVKYDTRRVTLCFGDGHQLLYFEEVR